MNAHGGRRREASTARGEPRRRRRRLAALLVVGVCGLATSWPAGAAAAGGQDVAQGVGLAEEGNVQFDFNAVSGPDGENPSGTISEFNPHPGFDFFVEATVTCLQVDGNRAVVTGHIDAINEPTLVGGSIVLFVVDNGTPGAGADLFTEQFFSHGQHAPCFIGNSAAFFEGATPTDEGEISVGDEGAGGNAPASVGLTPKDAVNPVGTSHTVTATVETASGDPLADTTVRFAVTGSVSAQDSCMTDASGQCSVTYAGPEFPGADQISAYADTDGDGTQESDEPAAVPVTKAWVLPSGTAGHVTGGGQIWNLARTDKVAFGFEANSGSNGIKGSCNLVDPSAAIRVKCVNATDLVQVGTTATVYGDAEVNGRLTSYKLTVTDGGEPGTRSDSFRLKTASGYQAEGTLTGGNVQVH